MKYFYYQRYTKETESMFTLSVSHIIFSPLSIKRAEKMFFFCCLEPETSIAVLAVSVEIPPEIEDRSLNVGDTKSLHKRTN